MDDVIPMQLDRPLMADCSTPRSRSSAITLDSTQAKVKTKRCPRSKMVSVVEDSSHHTNSRTNVHFLNRFSLD